jgi:hypothetical protein
MPTVSVVLKSIDTDGRIITKRYKTPKPTSIPPPISCKCIVVMIHL